MNYEKINSCSLGCNGQSMPLSFFSCASCALVNLLVVVCSTVLLTESKNAMRDLQACAEVEPLWPDCESSLQQD